MLTFPNFGWQDGIENFFCLFSCVANTRTLRNVLKRGREMKLIKKPKFLSKVTLTTTHFSLSFLVFMFHHQRRIIVPNERVLNLERLFCHVDDNNDVQKLQITTIFCVRNFLKLRRFRNYDILVDCRPNKTKINKRRWLLRIFLPSLTFRQFCLIKIHLGYVIKSE